LAISVLISWVVLRSRKRYRMAFEYVAFLPHAVPQVIFALGALIVAIYWLRWPVDLYGTLLLLVLVMAIGTVSFGTRVTHSALIQIEAELEEAAVIAGASGFTVMRRIVVPLIWPALVYGWLWLALLAFRQLTLPAMLRPVDDEPLAYVVWSMWAGGEPGVASAISVIMLVVLVPLAYAYLRLGRTNVHRIT
jgi:iron(III) transport system permease protein